MTEVIVGIDHRHARLTQANFQRSRPSRRHQRGTGKLGSVRKTARIEKIDDYEDAIAHDGRESSDTRISTFRPCRATVAKSKSPRVVDGGYDAA